MYKSPLSKKEITSVLPEKLIITALSLLLLAGSLILYIRDSKPLAAITVETGAAVQELSLTETVEKLKEERRININTASAEEITLIPGIGPAISQRIVEYRAKHGPFFSSDSLVRVKGIGPVKLEKIKEYVRIE